jgi:hypothetical protein
VLAIAQLATMAIGLTGAVLAPFVLSAVWLAAVSAILTRRAGARTARAPSPTTAAA